MTGIYKIVSPTGRVYIGQSRDIDRRWSNYRDLSRRKKQLALHSSLNKYGIERHKFEVIHELPFDIMQPVLDDYELLYYNFYVDCKIRMMNAIIPGRYSNNSTITRDGWKHTMETRMQMSIKRGGNGQVTDRIRGLSGTKGSGTHLKGKKVPRKDAKPIVQLSLDGTLISIHPYLMAACNYDQKRTGNVNKCCRGLKKSAYGYIWKYKEDYDNQLRTN